MSIFKKPREKCSGGRLATPGQAFGSPVMAICDFNGKAFVVVIRDDTGPRRLRPEGLEEMFRRMAFNVYADESDDHSKNFSFLLKEGGRWQLAPAYDLTGGVPSEAPEGDSRRQWVNCHALSINGRQSDITDDDLLAVADRYGIGTAPKVLREIKKVFAK